MTSQQIQQHFIYNIDILQTFINVFPQGKALKLNCQLLLLYQFLYFPHLMYVLLKTVLIIGYITMQLKGCILKHK